MAAVTLSGQWLHYGTATQHIQVSWFFTTSCLSKGYKNADSKGHMHPNDSSSIINNSQIMERAQIYIDWWMDKEGVVCVCIYTMVTHTYNGILLRYQREWNFFICNNVNGTRMYYAKQNKSVRERQKSDHFTHMWNLRNTTDARREREGKIR